jgi:hypothetical protein
VAMDAHAQATLRYIRTSMDAAALVVTPGSACIAIGLVGLVAALLAASLWRANWLGVWMAAAPLACVVGGAVMARQHRLLGRTLFGPSGRRFVVCMAPPLFAGAVLTVADLNDGNVGSIAGTWLLLYGSAVTAASATTIRLVGCLGVLFMLFGVAALLLPMNTHNLILGAGFGGLHLLFGGYLVRHRPNGR